MSWLQPTLEDEQDIQQLREVQPELYAYAQVLALALRIDSRLLRNLRLRFLPKSSVELETELWFSSLIHTRNVQAATMYSGIARALCDALKNENLERFVSTKAEIAKLTQHWPETDQIEQEMRLAVLEGDEHTLKKNVQRILKALTLAEGDFEKRELARWVKGTLPILKTTTQVDTEQQWLLQYVAASLGFADKWWVEKSELQHLPDALVRALPQRKKQKIGLRLRSGSLEILNPRENLEIIELSTPLPTLVYLDFETSNSIVLDSTDSLLDASRNSTRLETIWIGKSVIIPGHTKTITLRMIDGGGITIENKKFGLDSEKILQYDEARAKNKLINELSNANTPSTRRLEIGNVFSEMGDFRLGTGVREYEIDEPMLSHPDTPIKFYPEENIEVAIGVVNNNVLAYLPHGVIQSFGYFEDIAELDKFKKRFPYITDVFLTGDFNFDGFYDIAIMDGIGYGGVNIFYKIFFWNQKEKRFDLPAEDGGISNPSIDMDKEILSSSMKSGPFWYYTEYKSKNGKIYPSKETSPLGHDLHHVVIYGTNGDIKYDLIIDEEFLDHVDENTKPAKRIVKVNHAILHDEPSESAVSKDVHFLEKYTTVTIWKTNEYWFLVSPLGRDDLKKWVNHNVFTEEE